MDVLSKIELQLADGRVLDRNGEWIPIAKKLLEEKEWLRHLERGEVLVEGRWSRVIYPVEPKHLQRAVEIALGPESNRTSNNEPVPDVDDNGIPLPPKTQLIKVELMDTRLIETSMIARSEDGRDTTFMATIAPSATVAMEPSAPVTQVMEPSIDKPPLAPVTQTMEPSEAAAQSDQAAVADELAAKAPATQMSDSSDDQDPAPLSTTAHIPVVSPAAPLSTGFEWEAAANQGRRKLMLWIGLGSAVAIGITAFFLFFH